MTAIGKGDILAGYGRIDVDDQLVTLITPGRLCLVLIAEGGERTDHGLKRPDIRKISD
jgi:hypothetical protein